MSEGYDYQFLPPGPTDDQKCPICHLVVRNAYQVNCCGKILCKYCLLRYLEDSDNCPMCREDIEDSYFKDTRSDQEIKSLKVVCSYKAAGCDWSGELRNIEEHEEECSYQEVTCNDCKKTMLKRQLKNHLSTQCRLRKHKCGLCSAEGTYQFITSHHRIICPEEEVKCVQCTESIKRCKMPSHVAVCPKQVVTCPFEFMGCEFNDVREGLLAHIEEEVTSHVEMVRRHTPVHRVAPIVIKFSGYASYEANNEAWFSDGFYTGVGGYKVRLRVYANGCGRNKSTHISVFINLMPGANDDWLQFPMTGTFTISLLNQIEDENHRTRTVSFSSNTSDACKSRKKTVDIAGWGTNAFIANSFLDANPQLNTRYLEHDSLFFRVTTEMSSSAKPWLVQP